jgi:hypothetical protein
LPGKQSPAGDHISTNTTLLIRKITGDRAPVAADVARQLGIEKYWSDSSPIDKVNLVRRLQAAGEVVALVRGPIRANRDFLDTSLDHGDSVHVTNQE